MKAGGWIPWLGALLLCWAALPMKAQAQVQVQVLPPDAALVVVAVDNPQPELPTSAGGAGYRSRARYLRSAQAAADLRALERDYALAAVEEWPIELLGWHCALLQAKGKGKETADSLLERLRADPRVRLAQPLQEFQALGQPQPTSSSKPPPQGAGAAAMPANDPYLPLQGNLASLGALSASAHSSGRGVTVALVDTGIALHHPDLQGRRIERVNVVDANDAAFEGDRHGTQMAGVMMATVNNGLGIAGIAPDARLLAIKACWHPADAGRRARCNSFTLAQGLAAAVKHGAQIINLSLGGPSDALLARLAGAARERGISIVGASPEPGGPRGFPVDVPGVIEVAMIDQAEAPPEALRAPGRDILTLNTGGHYDFATGSSLAAAQVSAVAALLLQHRPSLRPAQLAQLLRDSRSASGLPNACSALAALDRQLSCDRP